MKLVVSATTFNDFPIWWKISVIIFSSDEYYEKFEKIFEFSIASPVKLADKIMEHRAYFSEQLITICAVVKSICAM